MVRQFGGKIGSIVRRTRLRLLNDAVVIGTAMLADMFIGIAMVAAQVRRKFGEQGDHVAAISPSPEHNNVSFGSSCFSSLALTLERVGPISVMVIGIRRYGFFRHWSAAQISNGDHRAKDKVRAEWMNFAPLAARRFCRNHATEMPAMFRVGSVR